MEGAAAVLRGVPHPTHRDVKDCTMMSDMGGTAHDVAKLLLFLSTDGGQVHKAPRALEVTIRVIA